jgi:N-acyl-D-amino-acid deacylase
MLADQPRGCAILFDTIIRNATVYDGTGADAFVTDVGVLGDRIAAIGHLDITDAVQTLDAQGLALAPGFIDVHTHDDTVVIRKPDCLPKISQGVTTVIVGNCGISASPTLLREPPPEPMNLLGKQQDFKYDTFASYVAAVECAQPTVNVAALIGHTTLRNNVLDDLFRTASDTEIRQMCDALSAAMAEGALGLSSGLAYATAKAAATDEVSHLARVVGEFDGIYTTHLRDEFDGILVALEEAFATARVGDVPVVISHLKCAGAGNWGRTTEVFEALDAAGKYQNVACDCYPYAASSTVLDLAQVSDDISIFITWSEGRPEFARQTLDRIAEAMGLSIYDAARALQPAGAVYHCMSEDDVRRVLADERTAIGSDGLPDDAHPHPRLWGTFPRVLGHYCRDEGLLTLAQAIHKMTGLSAHRYGLDDRGVIRVGAFADLVLFNPDTVSDTATYEVPIAPAAGIEAVFVNGVCSLRSTKPTGLRGGRFLKRSQRLAETRS